MKLVEEINDAIGIVNEEVSGEVTGAKGKKLLSQLKRIPVVVMDSSEDDEFIDATIKLDFSQSLELEDIKKLIKLGLDSIIGHKKNDLLLLLFPKKNLK